MIRMLILLAIAVSSPILSVAGDWPQPHGYDTSGIRDSSGWHEPDWSDWIAVQMGLDLKESREVRVSSGKRCDIVTQREAIEVEWVSHWLEAPGQATHYSIETGKRAAIIVLHSGTQKELEQVKHLRRVCERLRITLYEQLVPAK